jgi:hypothetical protein
MKNYIEETTKVTQWKIVILTIVLALITVSMNAQETVDTNIKYKIAKEARDTKNDCAVRALAEAYNLPYSIAYNTIEDWGRTDNKVGVLQRDFIKGMAENYMDTVVGSGKNERGTYPIYFINDIAKDGSTYFVMSYTHIFVIEQNAEGNWTIYGNSMDLFEKIYSFVEVRVPTAKAKGLTYKTTI